MDQATTYFQTSLQIGLERLNNPFTDLINLNRDLEDFNISSLIGSDSLDDSDDDSIMEIEEDNNENSSLIGSENFADYLIDSIIDPEIDNLDTNPFIESDRHNFSMRDSRIDLEDDDFDNPSMEFNNLNDPFTDLRGERVHLQIRNPRPRPYVPSYDRLPRIPHRPRPNRRGGRRGGPRNGQMEVDIDNMNYDQLLELENNIGHVSKGYSKQEIDSIPIVYDYEGEDSSCPICLEDIEENMPQLSIPCRHKFHIT